MTTIRKHSVLLTMMCLGLVGSCIMLLFVLLFMAASPPHPSALESTTQHSSGIADVVGPVLLIALMASVGWWVVAKAAGSLWRVNNDIGWKFMMCTGALGLVLSALFYDAVVLLLVRRLYLGSDELKLEILRASR